MTLLRPRHGADWRPFLERAGNAINARYGAVRLTGFRLFGARHVRISFLRETEAGRLDVASFRSVILAERSMRRSFAEAAP